MNKLEHFLQVSAKLTITVLKAMTAFETVDSSSTIFLFLPQVTPYVDYQYHLEFDSRKGFFCPKVNGQRRCLGASKGRRYPEMCLQCSAILKEFYLHYNVQLSKLLGQLKIIAPNWLREELTKG